VGGCDEGTHFPCGLMKEEGEANLRKPQEVPQITLHWHIIRVLCVELAHHANTQDWVWWWWWWWWGRGRRAHQGS
jgi:hypothetical protein